MVAKIKIISAVVMLAGIFVGSTMTGVHAQEGAAAVKPLNVEYMRPGTNYKRFHALLINDLDVSNTKIVPPPWKTDQPFRWEISEKNIGALQAAFRNSMRDQITADGGYPIVAEAGPGVMEINLRIVSFMPYAERGEKVTTRGSGEMRIHVEVRDARSGELLAMHEGAQEVGQDYGPNSDFARQENLQGLFDTWGRRIRAVMDKDHGRN